MPATLEGVTPIFPVRDLEVSTDYYVRVLGFQIQFRTPGIICSVTRGGCTIFLVERDQGAAPTYLWVGTSNVEALLEEIRARGGVVLHPPTNYSWGCEMQVADPDGNVIRFGSDRKPGLPDGEWRDMHGNLWRPLGGEKWELVSSRPDAVNAAIARRKRHAAQALRDLGEAERGTARTLDAARDHYEHAVRLYREIGDSLRLAHTLRHLGDLHHEGGRPEVALTLYEEAIALYEKHGEDEPLNVANALRSMAVLRQERGETAEAMRLWEKAHELYVVARVAAGVAESAARLAVIAHGQGDRTESEAWLAKAEDVARRSEDEDIVAAVKEITSPIR